jgi:hypothetical protein
MTRRVPREWSTYNYIDPVVYVTEQQKLRALVSATETPEKIRNLRTRKLAPKREAWDAGVFCYLLRERTGCEIYFAPVEDADFDAVFTWQEGGIQNFSPVQMKEVVPEELNKNQKIQDVLDSLHKYATSDDLVVAIKINRDVRLEADKIITDGLPVAEVWLFGATDPHEKTWGLFNKSGDNIEQSVHELPPA